MSVTIYLIYVLCSGQYINIFLPVMHHHIFVYKFSYDNILLYRVLYKAL